MKFPTFLLGILIISGCCAHQSSQVDPCVEKVDRLISIFENDFIEIEGSIGVCLMTPIEDEIKDLVKNYGNCFKGLPNSKVLNAFPGEIITYNHEFLTNNSDKYGNIYTLRCYEDTVTKDFFNLFMYSSESIVDSLSLSLRRLSKTTIYTDVCYAYRESYAKRILRKDFNKSSLVVEAESMSVDTLICEDGNAYLKFGLEISQVLKDEDGLTSQTIIYVITPISYQDIQGWSRCFHPNVGNRFIGFLTLVSIQCGEGALYQFNVEGLGKYSYEYLNSAGLSIETLSQSHKDPDSFYKLLSEVIDFTFEPQLQMSH